MLSVDEQSCTLRRTAVHVLMCTHVLLVVQYSGTTAPRASEVEVAAVRRQSGQTQLNRQRQSIGRR